MGIANYIFSEIQAERWSLAATGWEFTLISPTFLVIDVKNNSYVRISGRLCVIKRMISIHLGLIKGIVGLSRTPLPFPLSIALKCYVSIGHREAYVRNRNQSLA